VRSITHFQHRININTARQSNINHMTLLQQSCKKFLAALPDQQDELIELLNFLVNIAGADVNAVYANLSDTKPDQMYYVLTRIYGENNLIASSSLDSERDLAYPKNTTVLMAIAAYAHIVGIKSDYMKRLLDILAPKSTPENISKALYQAMATDNKEFKELNQAISKKRSSSNGEFNANKEFVDYLLKFYPDKINYQQYDHNNFNNDAYSRLARGNTLLHLAVWNQWIDIAKFSVGCGIAANGMNAQGVTPLMIACYQKDELMKEYFLNLKTTGTDTVNPVNATGHSALYYLLPQIMLASMLRAEQGERLASDKFFKLPNLLEIAEFLVLNGAQLLPSERAQNAPMDQVNCNLLLSKEKPNLFLQALGIFKASGNINIQDENGFTLLMLAVTHEQRNLFTELLSTSGLDVKPQTLGNNPRTALDMALISQDPSWSNYVAKELLKLGAQISSTTIANINNDKNLANNIALVFFDLLNKNYNDKNLNDLGTKCFLSIVINPVRLCISENKNQCEKTITIINLAQEASNSPSSENHPPIVQKLYEITATLDYNALANYGEELANHLKAEQEELKESLITGTSITIDNIKKNENLAKKMASIFLPILREIYKDPNLNNLGTWPSLLPKNISTIRYRLDDRSNEGGKKLINLIELAKKAAANTSKDRHSKVQELYKITADLDYKALSNFKADLAETLRAETLRKEAEEAARKKNPPPPPPSYHYGAHDDL
jgi:ankyrin repeat protein